MKLCISSSGPDLDSPFNPRFGRCDYFVFFDTDSGKYNAIRNEQTAADGAGVKAASAVDAHKPEIVLSGNIGPNAFAALQAAGVAVFLGSAGTVKDAADAWQNGKFTRADAPTSRGHQGLQG
ncbi:MAG: NifB/NifX family molybdenum-iron cluster-binding protein [Spirochaetales bacterium]|nr:NifB/NifX family molybdenum-iron cluster-binding protein [Spirochaetales bacterium]